MPLLRLQDHPPRFRGQGLILKGTIRLLLALGGGISVYLLAAVIGAWVPGHVSVVQTAPADPPVKIHLVAGPIHYDLLLPLTSETRTRFAGLRASGLPLDHPAAEWLIVGWGSRAFYTHEGSYSSVPLSTVWRAVSGDSAVMRVDVVGALGPDLDLPALHLSAPQYRAMLAAIEDDFARSATGTFIVLDAPGFTDTDRFFVAKGRFHIFRTCNTWVSRTLRRAGVGFGIWTPTPYAVTLSQRRFHPG